MNTEFLESANRTLGSTDPSLAVGLNDIAFYSTELPFINLFKQVGDRNNNDGAWEIRVNNGDGTVTTYDYSEAYHAGFLDENGYIDNLPEGASATLSLFNSIPDEAGVGGRYVFYFEGEGEFTVLGGNIVEELSEPGRLVIDLAPGTPFGLSVRGVDEENNLRDFALVREENVELYEAGQIFNPEFLELFEDFSVLRFIDWQETSNSNQIDFADLATFDSAFWGIPANQAYEHVPAHEIADFTPEQLAELPRGPFTQIYIDPQTGEPFRDADTGEILIDVPTDILPNGIPTGVPLEVMVELANQLGVDPWFNIPHQATDDYVRQFAEYVRDNLDPDLVAHFEYSNEVWNGQFEQFNYANSQGLEIFGDEFGDFPVNAYYGYRSAEVLDIVNGVFGQEAEARVHGVLATQTVNTGVLDQALIGAERYIAENNPVLTIDDLYDSVAVAGYYGPVVSAGSEEFPGHLDLYRSWIAESKARFANGETSSQYEYFIEQAIIDLRDSSLTQAFFQEAFDNGEIRSIPRSFSVAEIRELFAANKSIADQHGLELIQYEGGSHILTNSALANDAELIEFLAALNDSDEIAQINTEALIAFREEGGTLANDYVGVGQHTQFGPWGTLEYIGDESAVFDSYINYNNTAADLFGSINVGRNAEAFTNGVNDRGTDANDTLIGTIQEDFLAGGAGDDILVGGSGNDGLNGGEGFDTVVLSGLRSDYTITAEDDGFRIEGLDGSDFIINVEAISFQNDETILTEDFVAGASPFVRFFGGQTFTAVANDQQDPVSIIAVDPASVTGSDLGIASGEVARATQIIYFVTDGIVDENTRELILSGVENAVENAELISNVTDIVGTDFNDLFEGHANGELVDLGNGDDQLFGFGGNDTLSGGNGSDTIFGGEGDDVLSGGFGNDTIDGGAGHDVLELSGIRSNFAISEVEDGIQIIGAEGTDTVSGIEVVSFSDGQSLIVADWLAGVSDNVRYFGGGEYTVTNGGFAGVLISTVFSGTVTGDELGIVFENDPVASQVIYYVAARDNAQATFEAIHDNGAAAAQNVADLVSNIGHFNGTDFNDIFEGSGAGESVALGSGDDRLNGFGGDDTLDGGVGDDFLGGGFGNDVLIGGEGNDVINGGAGDDVLILSGNVNDYTITETQSGYVIEGIEGSDTLFGVERVQFENGQASTLAQWVGNATPGPQTFASGEFETGNASAAGFVISAIETGTQTATELNVPAQGFTNFLDTVFYVAARDNAAATFEAIHDGVSSALEVVDLITQVGLITGSDFDDIFTGAAGAENVRLGAGDDRLDGFGGNDTLNGGAGNDFIGGGAGDDVLIGGAGNDVINGGAGEDILVLSGLVQDYTIAETQSGFVIEGIEGVDTLFGVERVQFEDGKIVTIETWLAAATSGPETFAGGEFATGNASSAGFVIAPIEAGTQTAIELNIPAEGFTNFLDTVFFVAARDNAFATFEAIHDGVSSALQVATLITEVGLITGSDFNDIFTGTAGDENVRLGNGDDRLDGFGGDDTLFGGAGDDFIGGGAGNDLLSGGSGADVINGGTGFDTLTFEDATDAINLNFVTGNHTGAALGDQLFSVEVIFATDHADTLILGDGVFTAFGGEGNDSIVGGLPDNEIFGEAGNDTLTGQDGNDFLDGGADQDRLDGDAGNDTVIGGSGLDSLFGNSGNDSLVGGGESDRLFGGSGEDTLDGGNGNDVLFGNSGHDEIFGGEGDDLLEGGFNVDVVNGGDGNDTVRGGAGADQLFGAAGNDLVEGDFGDDNANGGIGNDTIAGGDGADLLVGEAGDDNLDGGIGDDTIIGSSGFDTLFGGEGDDLLEGGFNLDRLDGGAGNDTLNGGAGPDQLFGSAGNDLIEGDGGNDIVNGGTGNDRVIGGDGDDILNGRSGFDVLIGGAGDDTLIGAFNADTFVFEDGFGVDVIRDFAATNNFERIDLSAVTNITDFDDLVTNHLIVGADGVVEIVDGQDRIILEDVLITDLDASDFIF